MKRFHNILFVAQPDSDDRSAFRQAVALASKNQAQLTVIGVVDGPAIETSALSPVSEELRRVMMTGRRDELQSLVGDAAVEGGTIQIKVLVGKAFVEIIQEVLRHRRDIVIAAVTPPESGKQRLYAGTLMKLLRKCPCPLWLIKSDQQDDFHHIAAAVDHEPDNPEMEQLNKQIIEMASSLAIAHSSELHLVHAWQMPNDHQFKAAALDQVDSEIDSLSQSEERAHQIWLEQLASESSARSDDAAIPTVNPQLHLIHGVPRSSIPKCVQSLNADLMVMGTVAHTGIPGFLIGNTAEDILDQIDCSVLAIKPAGFVSPVLLTAPE